jgi:hypothetical protein
MGKVIWRDAGPNDPMYKEGYRSYSPHWAREFHGSKKTSPKSTAGSITGLRKKPRLRRQPSRIRRPLSRQGTD